MVLSLGESELAAVGGGRSKTRGRSRKQPQHVVGREAQCRDFGGGWHLTKSESPEDVLGTERETDARLQRKRDRKRNGLLGERV